MARYKAILAYDGTAFSGFQRQAEEPAAVPVRTVQGEIEHALSRIGWRGRTIYAAGRTDAGVHAAGQVVAFDLEWRHGPADLQQALNANLPAEISVRAVSQAPEGFHPRYAAMARRYAYRIFFDQVRDPLRERYAWRIWPPLVTAELAELASVFCGSHDFSAFGTPPKKGGVTVRDVTVSEWAFPVGEAVYSIEANAFLFRMVRRIVQAQVDAAQGRCSIKDLRNFLTGESPEVVQGLAPANGLSLIAVRYPDEIEKYDDMGV